MQYYIKIPIAGFVELCIENDDADAEAAIETAKKIAEEQLTITIKSGGSAILENYNFEFLQDLGDATVTEIEVESMEDEE